MVLINGTSKSDILTGSSSNDTINANAGNDTITGGAGNDAINGGTGKDLILEQDNHGNDAVIGGADQDTISYVAESRTILFNTFAGSINDGTNTDTIAQVEVVIASTLSGDTLDASGEGGSVTINLATGIVTGSTNAAHNFIGFEDARGSNFNDTLTGDSRANVLNGGQGDDSTNAGAGNDTLIQGSSHGSDLLIGGLGTDVVDYTNDSDGPIVLNSAGHTISDGVGTDTVSGIETILTTDQAGNTINASGETTGLTLDLSLGTASGLSGGIRTLVGFERLLGGSGGDHLTGNSSDNDIIGNGGADIILGGEGDDSMAGGDGNDTFVQTPGHDMDSLDGGNGSDTVSYATDSNAIVFDTAQDLVSDSSAIDTLANIEIIVATTLGEDTIDASGEAANVTINLATGLSNNLTNSKTLLKGFENASGGTGDDTLLGDTKANSLVGGLGSDTLSGGIGADILSGGVGADSLDGGADNDTFYQQSNHGADTIAGGSGSDRVDYSGDFSGPLTLNVLTHTVDDTNATDTLIGIESIQGSVQITDLIDASGVNSAISLNLATGKATGLPNGFTTLRGFEAIASGSGNDTLIGDDGDNTIQGNLGNDIITGAGGDDTLQGNNGDDRFLQGVGHGDDLVDGGGGTDTISYSIDSGPVTLDTQASTATDGISVDTLVSVEMIIATASTQDVIDASGEGGPVTINLATGAALGISSATTTFQGFEVVIGSDFADTLTGDIKANTLQGGQGDDVLDGGGGNDRFEQDTNHGNDTLTGGLGVDGANYSQDANGVITLNTVAATSDDGTDTDTLIGVESVIGTSMAGDVIDASTEVGNITINLQTGKAVGLTGGFTTFSNFEDIVAGSGNDVMTGSNDDNTITGNDGNDSLSGADGDDTLDGNIGNDTLVGGAGDDTLSGGNGDDTFVIDSNHGSDNIDGGGGNDTITYLTDTAAISFDTSAGTVSESGFTDTLVGVEKIIASALGADTIDASAEAGPVTINLATGVAVGTTNSAQLLLGFENIKGSSAGDTLTGDVHDNRMTGGQGNDVMDGAGGNDLFIQGTAHGDDTLTGGTGLDTADYSSDNSGAVTFNVTTGQLSDGVSTDLLTGMETIIASLQVTDSIDATGQIKALNINLQTGAVKGITGTFTTLRGFETLLSGSGNDILVGDSQDNTITGNDGNDTITGAAGDDTLTGNNGNDLFIQDADHGNDDLSGGMGTDTVTYASDNGAITFNTVAGTVDDGNTIDTIGGMEVLLASNLLNDTIDASAEGGALTINLVTGIATGITNSATLLRGFENIIGGDQNDALIGDLKANELTGGDGNDTLNGSGGNDTYLFADNFGTDLVIDNAGTETVKLTTVSQNLTITLLSGAGDEVTDGTNTLNWNNNAIENVLSGVGDDSLTGNTLGNIMDGGDGDDTITSGAGNDTLAGGSGNDSIDSGDGNDSITAGTGDNTIIAGIGNDELSAQDGQDSLDGGDGNDTLNGGAGNDQLIGGIGNDLFQQQAAHGNDAVDGGLGFDLVDYSGDNNAITYNTVTGMATDGNDTDTLTGIEAITGTGAQDTIDASGEVGAISLNLQTAKVQGLTTPISQFKGFRNLTAGSGDDVLVGNGADNLINGNDGRDTLSDGNGHDVLNGGDNGDTFLMTDDGFSDTVDGGAGNDKIFYDGFNNRIIYDTVAGTIQTEVATDTVSGVEFIVATNRSGDRLDASDETQSIRINFHTETFLDGAGNTFTIKGFEYGYSGAGNDILTGNDADNFFKAGAGNDQIIGGLGNDTIYGGSGDDDLDGGLGDDLFFQELPNKGNDTLDGGIGMDTVKYVVTDSNFLGPLNYNTTTGRINGDTLINIEAIIGAKRDVDSIDASGETTGVVISLAKGNISGTTSAIRLVSGFENAIGGSGDDRLVGDALSNTLVGNDGNDKISGGDGSDTIVGGTGDDTLSGGIGIDVYQYLANGFGNDTIVDVGGGNTLDLQGVSLDIVMTAAADPVLPELTAGVNTMNWTALPFSVILSGTGNDHITGSDVDEEIHGNNGNDLILGMDGLDNLKGDGGNDTIDGGISDDTILGGDGSDVLSGSFGDDIIHGGNETDDNLSDGSDRITGGEGNDQLFDGVGSDTLSGGNGDDILTDQFGNNLLDGGAGNDTIILGLGNDTLIGGTGDDSYLFANLFDDDQIVDAGGTDLINMTIVPDNLVVNLVSTIGDEITNGTDTVNWSGSVIENFLSGTGNDSITGNSGNNLLEGRLGDDTILGGLGDDTLKGGGGDDSIDGGTGNDVIVGDLGNDTMAGGLGSDTANYGSQSAAITFHTISNTVDDVTGTDELNGFELIRGTTGSDTIDSSGELNALKINLVTGQIIGASTSLDQFEGFENAVGGAGADLLTGNNLANIMEGSGGNDTLLGAEGNDELHGDDGDDSLDGSIGNDTLDGGLGNDILNGGEGENRYLFIDNWGNDIIVDKGRTGFIDFSNGSDPIVVNMAAGPGNELISGTNTINWLTHMIQDVTGGDGDDSITGDDVANHLKGQGGEDTILGALGNDTITGGEGNDSLDGGAGDDTFVMDADHGNDTVIGGQGRDTVQYNSNLSFVTFFGNDSTVFDGTLTDTLSQVEVLSGKGESANTIDVSALTNTVVIHLDTGAIHGINSSVTTVRGFNTIIGGSGNDSFFGSLREDVINGGDGNDIITGKSGLDTLDGGLGNDRLTGDLGDDSLTGGGGNDTLFGGAGTDTIQGGLGSDQLHGDDGNDHLNGDGGDDTLDGGIGNDTYVFDAGWGADRLVDKGGTDTLNLTAINANLTVLLSPGNDNEVTDSVNTVNWTKVLIENVLSGNGDDFISGNEANNSIQGGLGDDTLSGGAGADTLTGGAGSNQSDGGIGDDTFIQTGINTTDTLVGGMGSDIADYSGATNPITVDTESGTVTDGVFTDTLVGIEKLIAVATVVGNTLDASNQDNGINVDLTAHRASGLRKGFVTIENFQNVIGTDANDVLKGDNQINTLTGGLGEDTLIGGGGADQLLGGADNDTYGVFIAGPGLSVTIDDASGANDVLDLTRYALNGVSSWEAVDTNADTNVDELVIHLSNVQTIAILDYFDNTSPSDDTSGAGTGAIEVIHFANHSDVAFAQVQTLIP